MDFTQSAGYSTLSPHRTGGSGTQTQQELEEEVARSRADRAKRRSRLSGGAAVGSNVGPRPDGLPSLSTPSSSGEEASKSTAGQTSGAARSSAGLLARYGGAAGPTGHASVASAGPTSLASFIGGKASGPRLGKLAGDGRSAPPEYQGATSATEILERRALPGMAVGPSGGMAGMMEARKRDLAAKANQGSVAVAADKPQLERRQTSPTRPATDASAPSRLPEPVRASTTQSGSRLIASTPATMATQPLRSASPERTRSWDAPLKATGPALSGSKTATTTTSNALRSPSPIGNAASPTRSWQTPLRPASPERASQTKLQPASLAHPKTPTPSALASPDPNTTQKVSPAFSPQMPSSSEKPPSASITRLRGRSMVQQRLREAQERDAAAASAPDVTPALIGDLPQRSGVKKWAPPTKTSSASSLPAPVRAEPESDATAPTQVRKWTVPAVKADEEHQKPNSNAWTPGRGAQMLPGLGAPRSGGDVPSSSPTRTTHFARRDASPERSNAVPVRLPGMGGTVSPFKPRSPIDAEPTGESEAQREASEQKLTHLAAGRAKGPKRNVRVKPTTSPADESRITIVSAADGTATHSLSGETPAEERFPDARMQTAGQSAQSAILPSPPKDMDPTISRLLGSEQDTMQPIKPSERTSSDSTGRMSVREVEEGLRSGLPEAGKQRRTTGKRVCVLISGNGSNLQALIDATLLDRNDLPNASISLVVSNRKAAYGLQRAAGANPPIPTLVSALKTYQNKNPGATRDEYDEDLALKIITAHEGRAPDLIVLAGFMHIVSPTFLRAFGHDTNAAPGTAPAWTPANAVPIINLHPALPGAFDGAGAIERAYEAFQDGQTDKTGIMVHEVIAEVDRGAPIIVQEIPMRKGESLQELQERMHSVEHGLIVAGARKILERQDMSSVQPHSLADINPWADSTLRGKVASPSLNPRSPEIQTQALPSRPSAPTPIAGVTAHQAPPTGTDNATEAVDSSAQFASVKDSIASWGQPQQVSPDNVTGRSGVSGFSGPAPPLSGSSGSSASGVVPRARRRTLSRPSSVYGGSSPLPDLVEQPEGSVAEAAARWGAQSGSTEQATLRARKISTTNRPQTMYAAVPSQDPSPPSPQTRRAALGAPARSDSVRKLETQAAQLSAFVDDRREAVGLSPVSPVATPSDANDVKLDLQRAPPAPFDTKAFAAEHARLMAAREATLNRVEDPRETLSVEVISVLPTGSTVAVPEHEQHILYEGETLAVIHRRREVALVRTDLYVRTGRASSVARRSPAESARIQDLANRFKTSAVEIRPGDEPKALLAAFPQGTIVSRFGSRARWDEQGTMLYEIRVQPYGGVSVEQVDLDTSSLGSAFSYIASVVGSPFLWHGIGTLESERETTRALVAPLFPHLFSDEEAEIDVSEYIEGSEDDSFWAYFDQEVPYAKSAVHRSVIPPHGTRAKGAVMYNVRDAKVTPLFDTSSALKSASVHDADETAVQIVHSPAETYVLVGRHARAARQDIELALRVADTLARLNGAADGPVHVVISPTALPLELKKVLRGWNAAPSWMLEDDATALMNVLNIGQARKELEKDTFKLHELQDPSWLPCGVAPSDLPKHH